MAKHRKQSRLNPALVVLALFLGILFVLSLFSFVDIRNSNPIAIAPPTGQNTISPPSVSTTLAPTQGHAAPQISPSSRAINAPAPSIQEQKVPGQKNVVVTTTNNPPPLPLPTVTAPTTKPLLKLDNGLEVNVPLLNLGVTVAPLK